MRKSMKSVYSIRVEVVCAVFCIGETPKPRAKTPLRVFEPSWVATIDKGMKSFKVFSPLRGPKSAVTSTLTGGMWLTK